MSSIDIPIERTSMGVEVKEIERLLSRPQVVPNEFSTWVIYWLVQNIDISSYQMRGLASTFFRAATPVAARESTASGVMADLATVGPELTGLANGTYLAFWGATLTTGGADTVGQMGILPTGAAASDTHAAKGRTLDAADQVPIVYSRAFTMEGNDQNILRTKYMRVSGSNPFFEKRWLVAVKTAR